MANEISLLLFPDRSLDLSPIQYLGVNQKKNRSNTNEKQRELCEIVRDVWISLPNQLINVFSKVL